MSSNWENKLFNYKAEPPASAWDAIAAGLDKQKASFPEKLYNYTEQPPAAAWQAIAAQLPTAQSGKVVAMPLRKKIMSYAAAAVILATIAGIALLNQPANNHQATANTTVNNNVLNDVTAAPPAKRQIKRFNVPPHPADKTTHEAAKEKTAATYATAPHQVRNEAPRRQKQVNLPSEPSFATELDFIPQETNIINTDRADRYMIATSEEGQPVRLPKKVYSAFACPDDDPRHRACELQLTQLQQKMSNTLTTDFAHFLDLLKNLQEN